MGAPDLQISSTVKLANGVEMPLLGLGVWQAGAGGEAERAVADCRKKFRRDKQAEADFTADEAEAADAPPSDGRPLASRCSTDSSSRTGTPASSACWRRRWMRWSPRSRPMWC